MEATTVRTALIEVLEHIQAASGLDCPQIVGTTKPLDDLPQFDSKIWPVAIGILSAKLGVTIANDVNIFCREESQDTLTIDEIVIMVLGLTKSQSSQTEHKTGTL